jgi:hypothetical protein
MKRVNSNRKGKNQMNSNQGEQDAHDHFPILKRVSVMLVLLSVWQSASLNQKIAPLADTHLILKSGKRRGYSVSNLIHPGTERKVPLDLTRLLKYPYSCNPILRTFKRHHPAEAEHPIGTNHQVKLATVINDLRYDQIFTAS